MLKCYCQGSVSSLCLLPSVFASFSDMVSPYGGKKFLEAPAVHSTSLATSVGIGYLAPDTSSKKKNLSGYYGQGS